MENVKHYFHPMSKVPALVDGDVVFGGLLAFFERSPLMEPSPRVAALVERIKARPAYQASPGGA
jgi:hypothetical protein